MDTYVLNFAPTGMIPTKQLNRNTPISISEIVEDVLMAADEGAAIAHLHARDQKTEAPINDPEVYGAIIEKIREFDRTIVLCVSLSGRNLSDPMQRAAPLSLQGDAKPDMASLTLSSLNFSKQASVNAPDTIVYLAEKMKAQGIAPELEIFDLGMANFLKVLIRKGLVPASLYANILLGNVFGAQPSFAHIAALLSALPPQVYTAFAGLGGYQLNACSMGLAAGSGVRIGLEDNLWFDKKRSVLASNKSLLLRVGRIADELEITPMRPSALRTLLGLHVGSGMYGYAPNSASDTFAETICRAPAGTL